MKACLPRIVALEPRGDELLVTVMLPASLEFQSHLELAALPLGTFQRLAALLTRIERAGDFCDEPACPECLARCGHAPDCELAGCLAVLGGLV